MSRRPPSDVPERLLAADATDFERRVLEAALQKKPSPEASARMARALGVTAGAVAVAATEGTAAAAKQVAANATAARATAAAGATAHLPWVAVGVLGLVIAGAVVGARAWRASPPAPSARPTQPSVPSAGATSQPAAEVVEPTPNPAAPSRRARVAAVPGDVRDEIALLDAAREALSAGSDRRALEILRRYNDRYPSGSLRPEATAIKVEALMKAGREAEARALATRFVAEHRGSLLAKRVAELVGLAQPPASR